MTCIALQVASLCTIILPIVLTAELNRILLVFYRSRDSYYRNFQNGSTEAGSEIKPLDLWSSLGHVIWEVMATYFTRDFTNQQSEV